MNSEKTHSSSNGNKEHISFRIDLEPLNKLHIEAERKNISLNTLVNQIIKQYSDWYSFMSSSGHIPVWKNVPIILLQKYSESEIRSMAKEIAIKSAKDTVLLFEQKYDPNSLVDILEKWLNVTGYCYTHNIDGSIHKLIVQHDMGKKWSVFLLEIWKTMFSQVGVNKTNDDTTENTIVFEFDIA